MKKLLILVTVFAIAAPAMAAYAEEEGPGGIYLTVMYPGDTFSSSATLDWPFDYDIWTFILVGNGLLSVTLEDDGFMSDTMIAFIYHGLFGLRDWGWATSPDTLLLQSASNTLSIQFVLFSYLTCPGGYPAHYFLDAGFMS